MNDLDFNDRRTSRWDEYFFQICESVARKSPCLSRQIGAILVRDQSIIATGYNGPPRGFKHCADECPRRKMGYASGEGLEHCPAVHAESNAIIDAARKGASTINSTLYMNCIIPCKDCMAKLINAGIRTVVVSEILPYHALSMDMITQCKITARKFKL
jgi:dCMP deaminase